MLSGIVSVADWAVLIDVRREGGRWLQPSLGEEALREGWQVSVGQVEFDALNAMHGKEHDGGSERLAVADHHRQILKGGEFSAAQAEALRSERENHPPEFFARIAESRNHQRTGLKRSRHPGGSF